MVQEVSRKGLEMVWETSHRVLEMVWEAIHKCKLGIGAGSWRQMGLGVHPMQKNSPNSSCSSWLEGSNHIFYLRFTWQHNLVQEKNKYSTLQNIVFGLVFRE